MRTLLIANILIVTALIALLLATQAQALDGHGCGDAAGLQQIACPGSQGGSWVATDTDLGDGWSPLDKFGLYLDAAGFALSGVTGVRFSGTYPSVELNCSSAGAGWQVLANNPGYSYAWQCSQDTWVVDLGWDSSSVPPPSISFYEDLWLEFEIEATQGNGPISLTTDCVQWKRWPGLDPCVTVGETVTLYVPETSGGLMLAAGLPALVLMGRRRLSR